MQIRKIWFKQRPTDKACCNAVSIYIFCNKKETDHSQTAEAKQEQTGVETDKEINHCSSTSALIQRSNWKASPERQNGFCAMFQFDTFLLAEEGAHKLVAEKKLRCRSRVLCCFLIPLLLWETNEPPSPLLNCVSRHEIEFKCKQASTDSSSLNFT